ncbi:TPA: hypothetical protein N0F65_002075 [Lagenidium giganteum]|uniref:RNase III domain-containing protein n=1 Tax=Lagenidium giganteum TaxID=4803 RepID=A0AAV2ZBH1_9STRA|nr:TPA: hypothetical protein N0F65_002075 [Lagenidium giganteum]
MPKRGRSSGKGQGRAGGRGRSGSGGAAAATNRGVKRSRTAATASAATKRHRRNALDVVDHFHSLQAVVAVAERRSGVDQLLDGSAVAAAARATSFADVFEWVGDAVIGEVVGRCLLAQFHHAPLAARVFRQLRLALVTNENLARVYEHMGYERGGATDHSTLPLTRRRRRLKEKADVVEAVVGELMLRLEQQAKDERACQQYREHLDALISATFRLHFADCARRRALGASGPLQIAFNPFACLPEEHLDDETGDVVVKDGTFAGSEWEDATETHGKSFADLLDEYASPETKNRDPDMSATRTPFHAFATASAGLDKPPRVVHLALEELGDDHVLKVSEEIFEVFKIYGMAVLAERVSFALLHPHMRSVAQKTLHVTPASLTRQRQAVLSVSNLASCAVQLGIAAPPSGSLVGDAVAQFEEERRRANTLRAFVGYLSAIVDIGGEQQRAVNEICTCLHRTGLPSADTTSLETIYIHIPERQTLSHLRLSLIEARDFMSSKGCDALHRQGERPMPTKKTLLLRRCDSNEVEDLFEILAKQEAQASTPPHSSSKTTTKQKKKVKVTEPQPRTISANLGRLVHRRFLHCLEDLVVLFAQRKTDECRHQMAAFQSDLEPCAGDFFGKWAVDSSALTLAMRDSFYRLLAHDLCLFHGVISTSRNTRDGTRITQVRLPLHYSWAKMVGSRVTNEEEAIG